MAAVAAHRQRAAGLVSGSFVSAASHTSGTLTVMSGGQTVATIDLVGHYTTSNFQLRAGSGEIVRRRRDQLRSERASIHRPNFRDVHGAGRVLGASERRLRGEGDVRPSHVVLPRQVDIADIEAPAVRDCRVDADV
jgi:hypothetical protein